MGIWLRKPLTRWRQSRRQFGRRIGYAAVVPRAAAVRLDRFGVARLGLNGNPAQTVDDGEYEADGQK